MTTSSWGLGRRIGFRFAFLLAVLIVLPFPLSLLPKTDWFVDAWRKPWSWGVSWLAEGVFGIPDPSLASNGSGDRTFDYLATLLYILVAVLGTVVWSIADRRRTGYPRLAAAIWVLLRYYLAYMMLVYGFGKIWKSQFPDLRPSRLAGTVGDMSPMGLLWTFMGYSTPYTVFAGLMEALGGVLLLWRRTITIGALVVAALMLNVVMLNLCYDVPVKLFSMRLFVMAIAIAARRARPLLAAALGRAAPEEAPRVRLSRRWERARVVMKVALLGLIGWSVYSVLARTANRNAHVHELYGVWVVDSFSLDGVELVKASDAPRWHEIAFNPRGVWMLPMAGEKEGLSLKVNADNREIIVDLDDDILDKDRKKDKDGNSDKETWTYNRPTPEKLEIDGVHRGKRFHVASHLAPDPLLITRGFRWINEAPFNR